MSTYEIFFYAILGYTIGQVLLVVFMDQILWFLDNTIGKILDKFL